MIIKLAEMKNIHKYFGNVYAVKGIDFHVLDSEIVGLVGDNGAGKSTLIKILSGVYSPDKGDIFFKGKKVKFTSPKESRDMGIETIYQEQALGDDLSVVQNIFMGKEILRSVGPIKFLDHKNMEKKSQKLLDSLDLNIPSIQQKVRFCSGGERQGIAIARAMIFKAKLVIWDEPTRALGVSGIQQVIKFIKNLKNKGIASIIITHNLHHVYDLSDRIVVMVRGKKIKDVQKKDTSVNELTRIMIKKRVAD